MVFRRNKISKRGKKTRVVFNITVELSIWIRIVKIHYCLLGFAKLLFNSIILRIRKSSNVDLVTPHSPLCGWKHIYCETQIGRNIRFSVSFSIGWYSLVSFHHFRRTVFSWYSHSFITQFMSPPACFIRHSSTKVQVDKPQRFERSNHLSWMEIKVVLWRKMIASLWFVVVESPSCVRLFMTPWTAAHRPPLSFTISWSFLWFMSIEPVMLSNHLILCCPPSPFALSLSQHQGLF